MTSFDFAPLDFSQSPSISPTDIGAFGRLEGCERFLRLRLHTANRDKNWLTKAGLQKQAIPPLLTMSGADFESAIEDALQNPASPRESVQLSKDDKRGAAHLVLFPLGADDILFCQNLVNLGHRQTNIRRLAVTYGE